MRFQIALSIQIGIFLLFPPSSASKRARGVAFHSPSKYIQHWNASPGSQVSWAYNWASATDSTFPKDLEYILMLWSNQSQFTDPWPQNVKAALARGTSHLLAFNEPDSCFSGQSCISPADAVTAYKKHMMSFAGQASLGAPAVSNGPNGIAWLKQFMKLCTGCWIDFVPIHWYGQATNYGYLYEYIQSASLAAPGKEIWITEVRYSSVHRRHADGFFKVECCWHTGRTDNVPSAYATVAGFAVIYWSIRMVLVFSDMGWWFVGGCEWMANAIWNILRVYLGAGSLCTKSVLRYQSVELWSNVTARSVESGTEALAQPVFLSVLPISVLRGKCMFSKFKMRFVPAVQIF